MLCAIGSFLALCIAMQGDRVIEFYPQIVQNIDQKAPRVEPFIAGKILDK